MASNPFPFQLSKLTQWAFTGVLLSLPFQSGILVHQVNWGRGLPNPYLTILFTLPEALLFLSSILFFWQSKKEKCPIHWGNPIHFLVLLSILSLATISLFFSPFEYPFFHFFLLIKGVELLLFYLLLSNFILKSQRIFQVFIWIMSVEALWGMLQWTLQSDLGFSILGEPHLSESVANLARFDWGNKEWIRAYGTFSHPNILAGYLTVSLLLLPFYTSPYKYEKLVLFIIQLTGLTLTFSRSAFLGLILGMLVIGISHFNYLKTQKNRALGLSLVLIFSLEGLFLILARGKELWSDLSLHERWEGIKMGVNLLLQYPLGLGYNHSTLFLDTISPSTLSPWLYQPVHNIFLLIGIDLGWLGLGIVLLSALYFSLQRTVLQASTIALLSIGLFDHYLWTLDQGRLLVILIFGLSSILCLKASSSTLKKEA